MSLEDILAWWKSVTSTVTRVLSPGQLLSLFVTFLGVVGVIIGAAYWISSPAYRVLFSDMDVESAGAIVDDLRADEIPYRLAPGGRTVRVPADRIDELRLAFASDGRLPASGRIGFEIFDRTAFGATEFLEQVNFRRALEGEIARTIVTLSDVANARVHIAMSREPVFGSREESAKASVVLTLRSSTLRQETARGIANLVSASVEGLEPDAVVIVDGLGRSLNAPGSADGLGAASYDERRRQLEEDLTVRVMSLVEPVAGPGRVRANVSVSLVSALAEETREVWDPDGVVVRSRQLSEESEGPSSISGGVAGAASNLPVAEVGEDALEGEEGEEIEDPAAATSVPASAPGVERNSEVTNYEISKSVSRMTQPGGDIARLSVAVILDDKLVYQALVPAEEGAGEEAAAGEEAEPAEEDDPAVNELEPQTEQWPPEDIEKIRALVAASVGFDPARGDQLTIENIAFETVQADEPVALPFWQQYGPQVMEALRIIGILVVVVLGLLFGVRPLVKRVTTAVPAGGRRVSEVPAASGIELQRRFEAQLAAGESDERKGRLDALSNRMTKLSQDDPQNAALLVRAWLDEDIN